MADGYSNVIVFGQNEELTSPLDMLEDLWIMPISSPPLFGSIANLDNINGRDTTDKHLLPSIGKDESLEEDFDGCLSRPMKKRKLTANQAQFLENSFEVDNKLEPERKTQLAKAIGLDPSQVGIWFQNRRARFKNKSLEKDYDGLKSSFDKLKYDHDNLVKDNEKLKLELLSLHNKSPVEVKSMEVVNPTDGVDPENKVEISINSIFESLVSLVSCKQDDASSVISDVLDSDSSLHYTDHGSLMMEPTGTCSGFDFEQSQDEEEYLVNKTFLNEQMNLPKFEDDYYGRVESCSLGFSGDDQPFWSRLY